MFTTVSIQTYNHAKTLAITLESLRTLRCPMGIDYEILIVNNNSTDNTADVIQRYVKLLAPRLRSVFESKQGLSHARNRALQEAMGEIVCFIDDDVKVDPGWLEAVSAAFIKYSAAVVGGRSYLIYPTAAGRPAWLPAKMETLLSHLDYGDNVLVNTDKELFGLNFSVSRQITLDIGDFNSNLGRCGKSLFSGEDKEFCERIRQAGGVIVYEPKAVVGHLVPLKRLSKRWFLRRCYCGGVSSKRHMIIKGKPPKLSNLLIHTARCWGSLARTFFFSYTTPCDLFEKQMCAVAHLGGLVETARYFISGKFRGTVHAR